MATARSLDYRSDIDGLRGLAISLVLFFHLFPEWVIGGFVGVDVFFVISGFLITSIIEAQHRSGTWSIVAFYGARIRRLFPSLLIVFMASLAGGWKVLLPDEYVSLGRHLKAGLGFYENLLLRRETGYFDLEVALKPLAHLWSLSIEEQFYVLFPWIVWLTRGSRQVQGGVLVILFLGSFSFNLWAAYISPREIYLLPWTRFWELMAGALIAYGHPLAAVRRISPVLAQCLVLTGLAMIVVSAFSIRETTVFPGWPALAPVIGAALVIVGGGRQDALPGWLATRPLVMMGLISYPLYLWHWTLRSFLLLEVGNAPGLLPRCAVGLLSLLLAFLCYRYLEIPARKTLSRGRVTAILMLGALVIAGAAMELVHRGGFPERFPALILEATDRSPPEWRIGRCLLRGSQSPDAIPEECFAEEDKLLRAKQKKVLLWGDSFSAHLYPGLRSVPGQPFGITQLGMVACFPSSDFESPSARNCPKLAEFVLGHVSRHHYDRVLIAANWEKYPQTLLDHALPKTLEALKARGVRQIVLYGPPPRWTMGLPRLVARWGSQPDRLGQGFLANDPLIEARLMKLAQEQHVGYVSIRDHLCNAEGCLVRWKGQLTATDTEHLSPSGARFLFQHLERSEILGDVQ